MNGFALTVLYILASLLIGSILAFLIHPLFSYPFDRVLTRSVLVVLALLLIPLSKIVSKECSGLEFNQGYVRSFFYSFLAGSLVLLAPVSFFLFVDLREFAGTIGVELKLIPVYLVFGFSLALLIALFEEILFRGFLYGGLKHKLGFWFSLLFSSLVYSSVHFLKPDDSVEISVTWYSSFVYLWYCLPNAFDLTESWDARLCLLLLGCFLCLVRERFNLFWCVGFHAAFVFGIAVTRHLTTLNISSEHIGLVSHYNGLVGHLFSSWLVILVLFLCWQLREDSNEDHRMETDKAYL